MQRRIFRLIGRFDEGMDLESATAPFQKEIGSFEDSYEQLIDLSRKRERYNVFWAFSHAHVTLQQIVSELFSDQVKKKMLVHTSSHRNRRQQETIQTKFSVIERYLTDMIHKTITSSRAFRSATLIISAAEIIITLLIVLIVSEISLTVDRAVSIPQMSIIFIGVFGLIRMFLEKGKQRFLFNWRWNKYQDTLDEAFRGMSVMLATSFLLTWYLKQGTFLEKIDDLLEETLIELEKPETAEEAAARHAAHRTSRHRQMLLERLDQLTSSMDKQTVQQALRLPGNEKPGGMQESPSIARVFSLFKRNPRSS